MRVSWSSLSRLGLAPGPWLGALTERLAAGDTRAMLTLPGGRKARVADLEAAARE